MNYLYVKGGTNAKPSRIPVPVASLKPTNLSNEERNKDKKISASKLQKPQSLLHQGPTKPSDAKNNKNSNNLINKKSVAPKSGLQSSRTNSNHNVYKKGNNFVHKNFNKKPSTTKSDTSEKETNAKCSEKVFVKNKAVLKCDNVKEKSPVSERNMCDPKREVKLLTPRLNEKKCTSPNQYPFSAQKDIKFEANEFYRKMILSNRELSPSIMHRMPSLRLSNLQAQRPSYYTKMELSADPYKEALKAIENLRLSAKRNRKLPIKENKLPQSPFKDRPSFYTPYTNPKEEVMNCLKQLKLQRMQKNSPKSTKKVTFNLNIQECSPVRTSITGSTEQTSECRLIQITENSKENTPLSPENNRTVLSCEKENASSPEIEYLGNCNTPEKKEAKFLRKCVSKSSPVFTKSNVATLGTTFSDSDLPAMAKHETPVPILNQTTVDMPNLKQKDTEGPHVASARIYTPKPISLFAKYKISDSSSPEFLTEGKSAVLAKYAPICTPLVLKSIAKTMCSPEAKYLSPVRLKLDFADVEKGSPRNKNLKKKAFVTLETIETLQKKLDDLADQECFLLLLDENTSVVCGRYLTNPVAQILNEGDDMHFIPVQL